MRQQGVILYLEKLTRNHRIEFRHLIYCLRVRKMVEGGGFEPPKLSRQIYSLIPLATREPLRKAAHCPEATRACQQLLMNNQAWQASIPRPTGEWSWREESNPGPTDYKSVALPTELYRHER